MVSMDDRWWISLSNLVTQFSNWLNITSFFETSKQAPVYICACPHLLILTHWPNKNAWKYVKKQQYKKNASWVISCQWKFLPGKESQDSQFLQLFEYRSVLSVLVGESSEVLKKRTKAYVWHLSSFLTDAVLLGITINRTVWSTIPKSDH